MTPWRRWCQIRWWDFCAHISLPWYPRTSPGSDACPSPPLADPAPREWQRGHTARGAGDTVAPRDVWAGGSSAHTTASRDTPGCWGTPGSPCAALQKPWQVCATLKLCRGEPGAALAAPIFGEPGTYLQVRGQRGGGGGPVGIGTATTVLGRHRHAVSPAPAAASPSRRAPAGPGWLRRRCRCRCAGCAARWWLGPRPLSP